MSNGQILPPRATIAKALNRVEQEAVDLPDSDTSSDTSSDSDSETWAPLFAYEDGGAGRGRGRGRVAEDIAITEDSDSDSDSEGGGVPLWEDSESGGASIRDFAVEKDMRDEESSEFPAYGKSFTLIEYIHRLTIHLDDDIAMALLNQPDGPLMMPIRKCEKGEFVMVKKGGEEKMQQAVHHEECRVCEHSEDSGGVKLSNRARSVAVKREQQ